jgi:2-polyprenyl-6-methoxyphenol hydroxylase-like FAD-dependent oxidoreductase
VGNAVQRFQVIIVGGGPVGMALAVDLGQRDVSVAVIERGRDVGLLPKGQGLTHRTLEHFYYWGCLEELRNIRLLPDGYPIGGVLAYGSLNTDFWHPYGAARDQLHRFYFQKNDRVPQYLTEAVLRRRVAELASVSLLYEHTVTAVSQDDNGTRVQISPPDDPHHSTYLEADFVVGCDGAASTVLAGLGVDRSGTDFDTRMVLAVFDSEGFHSHTARFGERTTFHAVSPQANGAWHFWGRVEAENSFFFHAPVPHQTSRMDVDVVHQTMERAAGVSFEARYRHIGFWSLRTAVAETYRQGRVFVAGDAAHSHPPYGGFGLNTGLEDVTNLGWKLSAWLEGWGGEKLLDSYTLERRPVAFSTCEDVIVGSMREERQFCDEHSPKMGTAAFDVAWRRWAEESQRPLALEPHYAGSPIVCGSEDCQVGLSATHSMAARAGHHLAPQALSNGRNVFEELGSGFTLLSVDGSETDIAEVEEIARTRRVPLNVIRDSARGGREDYDSDLVLIRPDQFVAWTHADAPIADLATAVW